MIGQRGEGDREKERGVKEGAATTLTASMRRMADGAGSPILPGRDTPVLWEKEWVDGAMAKKREGARNEGNTCKWLKRGADSEHAGEHQYLREGAGACGSQHRSIATPFHPSYMNGSGCPNRCFFAYASTLSQG